jgi:surfactin synthase thioesterase subunit
MQQFFGDPYGYGICCYVEGTSFQEPIDDDAPARAALECAMHVETSWLAAAFAATAHRAPDRLSRQLLGRGEEALPAAVRRLEEACPRLLEICAAGTDDDLTLVDLTVALLTHSCGGAAAWEAALRRNSRLDNRRLALLAQCCDPSRHALLVDWLRRDLPVNGAELRGVPPKVAAAVLACLSAEEQEAVLAGPAREDRGRSP